MRWDYGDIATVEITDTSGARIERPCTIVGICIVASQVQAEAFNSPIGTSIYTVEFADGSSVDVPGNALTLHPE